jgi:hypothetical protein
VLPRFGIEKSGRCIVLVDHNLIVREEDPTTMVRGRGVVLEVRADEAVGPLGLWGEVLPRLIQWASRKKRI